MERFCLNGIPWTVCYVPYDSSYLVDRTGNLRLATTDIRLHTIYLNEGLSGNLLMKVTFHEIGHAVMTSFGLIEELHRLVKPEHWIEAEEWVCNLLADYAEVVVRTGYTVTGYEAINRVVDAFNRCL